MTYASGVVFQCGDTYYVIVKVYKMKDKKFLISKLLFMFAEKQ